MDSLENKVRSLLARGRKLEAIKYVFRQQSQGLKAAKEYVDAIQNSKLPSSFVSSSSNLSDETLISETQYYLNQGKKIIAIKKIRELTGWGLKETKAFVDAVASGKTGSNLPRPAPSKAYVSDQILEMEARRLLDRGRKIEAIKKVRGLTGWGLKEAKDFVDKL